MRRATPRSDDANDPAGDLPPGWTWVRVEGLAANEAGALTDGPFGSNLKTSHYTESGPRVIRLQNIGAGFFNPDKAHIAPEHFERLRRHEAKARDIVVAMLGESLPRACLVPDHIGPAIVKADCARFRVHSNLALPQFVAAGLNSHALRQQADELIHGVGRPRLGLRWLRTLLFPLAPLPEQHRIVEAIESYFTRLADAVTTLERAQRNLKRYRASVLKAAVEGRLVPTEAVLARAARRDYEPASVLLERILAARRCRWETSRGKDRYQDPDAAGTGGLPELAEGWCWTRIGTVGRVQLGRQRSPRHHTGPLMRPYLRVANVFEDRLSLDDVKKMNFGQADYESYRLESGDILLNEGQSPHLVGRAAMYRGEVPGCCFQNTLVRFRAEPGIEPGYALIVFRAQLHSLRYLRIAKITTNIAHLGAERFAAVEFPVPPLAEQRRIIVAVEDALSLIAAAEHTVNTSLRRCLRLRQAVLKWAFEGKLADQDPNDEPVSVLLERIRAERAAVSPTKKLRNGLARKTA